MRFNFKFSSFPRDGQANIKVLGVAALVAGATMLATSAYAGFSVGSVGSAKSLTETPSADVFGNSLDNLKNGALSTEDLEKAGLTFSACGSSPLADYVLDYLETVLDQDAADTSDWQTDIDGISDCDQDAAIWKIGAVNDNTSGHSASDLSASMFDEAIESAGYTSSILGADSSKSISDVQALFPSALASVTTSSIKTLIAETVGGFSDQTEANAFIANSDKANFTLADFQSCYSSTDSNTGGANTCTTTSANWASLQTAINLADNASSSSLTSSNVATILAMDNSTSAAAALNTSSTLHLDYLGQCISGSSNVVADLNTCANAFTEPKANAFKVGKIIDGGDSDYPASALTTSLLQDVGVDNSSKAVIDGNYCGASANSSCWTLLKASLTSSDLSASSSVSDVTSKVNSLMRGLMVNVADNASIPAPSSLPTAGCSTSYNFPIAGTCGHPQWTCTLVSGPTGWTLNGNDLVMPSSYATSGTATATIRASLNIYTPAYTKDYTRSYNITAAVSGASNGLKTYSTDSQNRQAAYNACVALGGRLATKSEYDGEFGSTGTGLFASATDEGYPGTSGAWNTCTGGWEPKSRKHNGYWYCGGSSFSATKYYACADLPDCS
ncbi:MAG: hypothetical protein J4F41_07390 [Alphaproteobacteria bacterium]|nr:hypothetical protein [Alphaproteobacteria bacterium]